MKPLLKSRRWLKLMQLALCANMKVPYLQDPRRFVLISPSYHQRHCLLLRQPSRVIRRGFQSGSASKHAWSQQVCATLPLTSPWTRWTALTMGTGGMAIDLSWCKGWLPPLQVVPGERRGTLGGYM